MNHSEKIAKPMVNAILTVIGKQTDVANIAKTKIFVFKPVNWLLIAIIAVKRKKKCVKRLILVVRIAIKDLILVNKLVFWMFLKMERMESKKILSLMEKCLFHRIH